MVDRNADAGDTSSLDEVSAERLLRGQRAPAGASSGEESLSRLLAAAAAPPSADELSGEPRAVAAFVATRPATAGPRHARRVRRQRKSVLTPRISHGVAAAAALGVLTVGGMAAAAYTGSLPSSMQRLAHEHLGAPAHHHGKSPHAATTRPSRTVASAMRSTDPSEIAANPGLSAAAPIPGHTMSPSRVPTTAPTRPADRYRICTAYVTAMQKHDAKAVASAYRVLVKAAGGPFQVAAYCAPVWPPGHGATPDPNPEPRDPVRPSGPQITIVPQTPNEGPPS